LFAFVRWVFFFNIQSSTTGVLDWPRAAKNIFKFQKIKRMGTNHGYEVGLHGMQTAQPLLAHREPTLVRDNDSAATPFISL